VNDTFAGNISGTNAVNVEGPANLTLSGSNAFSGTVNDLSGNLIIGSGLTLQNAAANITGGLLFANGVTTATVSDLDGTANFALQTQDVSPLAVNLTIGGFGSTYAGVISGSGSLIVNTNGVVELTNADTYTGGTVVNASTLQLGDGSSNLGSVVGTINLASSSASLSISNYENQTFTNVVTGSGGVQMNGASGGFNDNTDGNGNVTSAPTYTGAVLTVTGNQTYTGTTQVNSGALFVGTTGNFSTTTLTVNSGAVLAGTGKLGNVIIAGGGTLAPGLGNSYTNSVVPALGSGTNIEVGQSTNQPNAFNTLTISGSLLWNGDNSVNYFNLASNGTNVSDKVLIGGTLTNGSGTPGGIITIDFEDTGYFDGVSLADSTYTLMTATGGISGFSASQFSAENVGPGGVDTNISYFKISGNSLQFVVVPEPATWGLLLGGVALLLGLRRKRALKAGVKNDDKVA
jgi:autotransporter-associated beta strand protein